ncbi:tripartite tricarboxylate transporter substrate binding protein, partial [Enterocloster aldenensis]|nr:tripartite tricarboxylate transporter substrate binding protein [Enterocloster aldenensis]MCG4749540.1 tripartite tricarboxylate transporter substrate binding protein [Enterocloster aldenensis]
VGKLYEIFSKAVEKESFKNFMGETNNDIDILNGEEFNKKIAEDYALFGTLIESLGLDKQ